MLKYLKLYALRNEEPSVLKQTNSLAVVLGLGSFQKTASWPAFGPASLLGSTTVCKLSRQNKAYNQ